jgi:hypothetical protein
MMIIHEKQNWKNKKLKERFERAVLVAARQIRNCPEDHKNPCPKNPT